MSNRMLDARQRALADQLLLEIRQKLAALSAGDAELLFAFRRKVAKELSYDERSKPAARKKLKTQKRAEQKGKCPLCKKPLPDSYCVLDRFVASAGYTAQNTRLICAACDAKTQASRGYR